MYGPAFFFVSLVFRFLVVVFGALGATIGWLGLSAVVRLNANIFPTLHRHVREGHPDADSLIILTGLIFAVPMLISILVAGLGLWLCYRRLRGGLGDARYNVPEDPRARFVSAALFGLFGLFFLAFTFIYGKAVYKNARTTLFASHGEAVVHEIIPDKPRGARDLEVTVTLSDGSTVDTQIRAPYALIGKVAAGDRIAIVYWPHIPRYALPADDYTYFDMAWGLFWALLIAALALAGLSGFWACVKGPPPTPYQPRFDRVSRVVAPARNAGAGAQFGRRR